MKTATSTKQIPSKYHHLKSAKIAARLPDAIGRVDSQRVPNELVGARIVGIGTLKDPSFVEGGGLVIDFMPQSSSDVRRIVLAFNDTAMWIDYLSTAPSG